MPTQTHETTSDFENITAALSLVDGQAYVFQPRGGPVSWYEGANAPGVDDETFLVGAGYPWRFSQGAEPVWISAGGGTKIVVNEA